MGIKTSQSYQKEVLEKYRKEKGGEMSNYLMKPTRKNIRLACLWLLDRRKEKNDEYILNRFFQFKDGQNKALHIQSLKSEKADKFIPIVNFLNGKTNDTSDENLELISWLIDFKPRPVQEYLKSNETILEEEPERAKTKIIDKRNDEGENNKQEEEKSRLEEERRRRRRIITISISVAFGMTLMILGVQKWPSYFPKTYPERIGCMTWADSLYVEVSCDESPFSKYGTQVKPLAPIELKNMRKVEVHAGYKFFSEDDKPLIWYYKKYSKEIEYFTAPGLHPTNGETLRKITPYIIQTYVPFHNEDEQTSIKNQDKDFNKNKLSLFIFDKNLILNEKATGVLKTYLKNNGYFITTPLLSDDEINQEAISNLKSLNFDFFQGKISDYTDNICLGEVKYSFNQSEINKDLFKCRLSLDYSIISVLDRNEISSFSRTATGIGFNENEAEQNAFKKLFYDK